MSIVTIQNLLPIPTAVFNVVTGKSVHMLPRERIELATMAAMWRANRLFIEAPTLMMASSVFGTSIHSINAAARQLNGEAGPIAGAAEIVNALWPMMTPREQAEFVTENSKSVLEAEDLATSI